MVEREDAGWEIASLPERTFIVAPSAESAAAAPPAESVPAVAQAAAPRSTFWPIASALLAIGWLATALAWWRSAAANRVQTPGMHAAARTDAKRPQSERKLLADVLAACAAADADAARRALLAWAEARFTAPPRSLGALASELPEPAGHEILALEAHIYGSAPGRWDGRALAAALAELDAARARQRSAKKRPCCRSTADGRAARASGPEARTVNYVREIPSCRVHPSDVGSTAFCIWNCPSSTRGATARRSPISCIAASRGCAFGQLAREGFRDFYIAQNLPRARLSGLIALILVLAVTSIDLVLGTQTTQLNTLRLGVLCPLV